MKNLKKNLAEDFDKLPYEAKLILADRTGFSDKEFGLMRQLLVEAQQETIDYERERSDRDILDNIDFGKIQDTIFTRNANREPVPFVSEFEKTEMVKLVPKKVEKVSRQERLRRQKERE